MSKSVNMAAQDEVDVCESWEDMDEIGLENKFKLMSCEPDTIKSEFNGCKVTNVILEDSSCMGSHCIMPGPAIKILKRPSSLGNGQLNGEGRARPVKTLQQRQKEYEEARLRILGEARSPEDVVDDNLTRLQDKLQTVTNTDKTKSEVSKTKERKLLTRLPAGAPPIGFYPSPPPPGVLVIRTPRGPDGTKGFVRR